MILSGCEVDSSGGCPSGRGAGRIRGVWIPDQPSQGALVPPEVKQF